MISIVDIRGGSAHWDGVSFHSNNAYARAYRKEKSIEVDSGRISKLKKRNFLDDIPIIRGLMLPIRGIILSKVFWIALLLMISLMFLLVTFQEEKVVKFSNSQSFHMLSTPISMIFIVILLGTLFIRFTKVGKYHAAEHMTFHAYEKELGLTIANINKQSRVHEDCGTNLVFFVLFLMVLCDLLNIGSFLSILISWSVGYEIWYVKDGWFRKLTQPIYWLGGLAQYYLFTSKPSEKELEVAVESLKELIKASKIETN